MTKLNISLWKILVNRKNKMKNLPTKCICRDQLDLRSENIICHLSWCPQSYVYKEDMEAYEKAPWWKKLFMYKPWKHPYGY